MEYLLLLLPLYGTPVWIASASFSFALLITRGIVKKLSKTAGSKGERIIRLVTLASSKLNSIKNTTFKALIDNEISHEDLTTIIN